MSAVSVLVKEVLRIVVEKWLSQRFWLNHAKIISVDGNTVLTGEHNLRTLEYLENASVYNVSIEIHGQAELAADRFVNQLRRYICKQRKYKVRLLLTCNPIFIDSIKKRV